jgi:hypothetical protein
VRRRHPDVKDRDVRTFQIDEPHELTDVPGLADDLEAGCRERAGKRLTQEDGIVG